jgi:signal transduction histidine kinase
VDDLGRELELSQVGADRTVTLVRDGDEPVAALVHDTSVLSDEGLVDSVAAAARIAVANARLQAEVRRQLDELEASRRRIVEAGDAQRRRLETELHEGAELRLSEVASLLDGLARDGGDSAFEAMLVETQGELVRARKELGEFARGVHPRILTDGGLKAAVADLAARAAVPVEVSVADGRFPAPLEAAAYFVCSEGLANVGKYAEASRAAIAVEQRDGRLVVSVRDDGRGGASLDAGSGLRGLADRVEAVGGRLLVESPPGKGTVLSAELPLS